MSLLAGILVTGSANAQNVEKRNASPKSALSKYAWDLTPAAQQGRFDSLTERLRTYRRQHALGFERINTSLFPQTQKRLRGDAKPFLLPVITHLLRRASLNTRPRTVSSSGTLSAAVTPK